MSILIHPAVTGCETAHVSPPLYACNHEPNHIFMLHVYFMPFNVHTRMIMELVPSVPKTWVTYTLSTVPECNQCRHRRWTEAAAGAKARALTLTKCVCFA